MHVAMRVSPCSYRRMRERSEKNVLSASMHDWLLNSFDVFHAFRAGVFKTCLLLHGQRVDVSSQQQRLAFAIAEHGSQTVAADVRVDLERVEGFEVLDDGGCGFLFAEGELGVRVKPFIWVGQSVSSNVVNESNSITGTQSFIDRACG